MKCPSCQTENPITNQFCINCGKPLTVQPPSTSPIPTNPQIPKTGINPIIPAIISLFFGGPIVAVIMYFLWKTSWSKKAKILITAAIYICIILALVGIGAVGFLAASQKAKTQNTYTQSSSLSQSPSPSAAVTQKTKYDIDTDTDGIPDSVEVELGFDPNITVEAECARTLCSADGSTTGEKKQKNILLVLDSSGSMNEAVSGTRKIDAAKQAIKDYAVKIPEGANIGLMVYGHKGSNSTNDKAASCVGIDVVYPLNLYNQTGFTTAVNSFTATGWTPLGGALRKSKDAFLGKEGQDNVVIVVSDGIETCNSDPIGAAQELRNSGIKAQIDVIGFAVDSATRAQLEQVAQIGGGKYYSASSATELGNHLQFMRDNAKQAYAAMCVLHASLDASRCIADQHYYKAINYLADLRKQYETMSKDEQAGRERAMKNASEKMKELLNKVLEQDKQNQADINKQLSPSP